MEHQATNLDGEVNVAVRKDLNRQVMEKNV